MQLVTIDNCKMDLSLYLINIHLLFKVIQILGH